MPKIQLGIRFLYGAIFLCYLFAHIDVGILSISNEQIKTDIDITEG